MAWVERWVTFTLNVKGWSDCWMLLSWPEVGVCVDVASFGCVDCALRGNTPNGNTSAAASVSRRTSLFFIGTPLFWLIRGCSDSCIDDGNGVGVFRGRCSRMPKPLPQITRMSADQYPLPLISTDNH